MADQYCPSCGTEVDADARFCPTCGTTLAGDDDTTRDDPTRDEPTRDAVTVLPEAPSWPAPAPPVEGAAEDDAGADAAEPADTTDADAEREQEPPPVAEHDVPPAARAGGWTEMPFTWPATIGGWLIGGGAGLGALALIPRLNDMLSLFLFLALLGVTATVFLADRLPDIKNLRLLVLVTVMVGLGVALDRAAFTVRGLETILLIAMLAAAGGVLLVELDRDRAVPPPTAPRA